MVGESEALTLVNPTVQKYGDEASKGRSRARRLDSLAGKTIGLLWNAKPFGDVALRTVQRRLEDMYDDIEFRFYSGNQPHAKRLLDKAQAECDAFVLCTADCGGCCLWAVHDAIEMEKVGKPAVVIVSHGFETNALAAADAFSMRDFAYVVVPRVYNNLSTKEAEMQTEPIIDDIVKALTDVNEVDREGDATSFGRVKPSSKQEFVYSEGDSYENFLAFNREFLDRDWGDGFLLHPPTRNAVTEMTSMVDGQPDDVVCMLPPGNGEATVALVAANAVMAGCKPAELPVVMAALRAIARNGAIAMSIVLTSTSAHACFIVVNGPLGRQLGINGKRACLGPGKQNEVNLRIGRAVVLCLKNIGRWYPGVLDLDTIGTSRKFINVIAENEEENPWEPYHVSLGFDAPADTVTTFWSSGEWDVSIQGHKDADAVGSRHRLVQRRHQRDGLHRDPARYLAAGCRGQDHRAGDVRPTAAADTAARAAAGRCRLLQAGPRAAVLGVGPRADRTDHRAAVQAARGWQHPAGVRVDVPAFAGGAAHADGAGHRAAGGLHDRRGGQRPRQGSAHADACAAIHRAHHEYAGRVIGQRRDRNAMADNTAVDTVIQKMNAVVATDGGRLTLESYDADGDHNLVVRYEAKPNEECATCSITSDLVSSFLADSMTSHGLPIGEVIVNEVPITS